ncbi:Nn.00g067300.m01.CDS01 [Neocucurbitaria sp. VM-36]
MVETNSSQSPISAAKPSGGRQRVISSCLTCRRRKVKCDHVHPVQVSTGTGRISKPLLSSNGKIAKNSDVQARLDRLELLLERAVAGHGTNPTTSVRSSSDLERKPEVDAQLTPSSNSQTSHGGGMASDDGDGTLLLDGGQSQFVSSLHYALLADEIQDIKALLGDKTDEERKEIPQSSLVDLLSLGRAGAGSNLEQLLPSTQEHRDTLLDVYFANVDPMVRITHKPTVLRKFPSYNREAHPMAFAIFFSAINSLPPKVVQNKFGESKENLLERFQLGVEISLARENYLTTSSLEIFQGFVLWLTCITKEEDMGKAWVLLGIAVRIALNQGLHRDPSLFPTGSMDAVTIELRRRMWHQLGHLEFRAAECKGQEPSISEDFYTTLFPRNIDDEELVDGASPGPAPYDEEKFTTMSFQLVRYMGMRALRRIVQSTYRLERRMLDSGLHGASRPDFARELQNLYEQIKVMLDEVHEENQRKYLRYLNPEVPMQRLTLGLASLLEWRCYLLFWLRMPRAYRDDVFSDDTRRSIFEKSVNCIETLNGAAADVHAARFQWHIGSIASFQAIMHVLSELRNPLFDAPDRQRALSALQMSRILRENNGAKAWQAVKNMIDKAVAEHNASPRSQSQSSSSLASPNAPLSTSIGMENPSNGNVSVYPVMGAIPSYALPTSSGQYIHQDLSAQAQDIQPPSELLQPMQSMQAQGAPCWDDINLSNINNIVGDVEQSVGMIPDFDFGFWGDPFNYENEPAAMPMQDSYFPSWSG